MRGVSVICVQVCIMDLSPWSFGGVQPSVTPLFTLNTLSASAFSKSCSMSTPQSVTLYLSPASTTAHEEYTAQQKRGVILVGLVIIYTVIREVTVSTILIICGR